MPESIRKWQIESNEAYHSDTAIGASGIVDMLKSGAHFKCGNSGPSASVAHKGTVAHAMLLEPDRFRRDMVIEPKAAWTKAGKPEWLDFFQELEERNLLTMAPYEAIELKVTARPAAYKTQVIHLSENEIEMVAGIKRSVLKSDVFIGLLAGIKEQSGYLESSEEFDNIILKNRPDIRCPERQRIVDIKTTVDAEAFMRKDVVNLQYHVKAAWYIDISNGIDETADYRDFTWLAIEKTPPFAARAYSMDIDSDEFFIGRKQGLKALERYRECLKADTWPCYDDKIQVAKLPNWYLNQNN